MSLFSAIFLANFLWCFFASFVRAFVRRLSLIACVAFRRSSRHRNIQYSRRAIPISHLPSPYLYSPSSSPPPHHASCIVRWPPCVGAIIYLFIFILCSCVVLEDDPPNLDHDHDHDHARSPKIQHQLQILPLIYSISSISFRRSYFSRRSGDHRSFLSTSQRPRVYLLLNFLFAISAKFRSSLIAPP